MDYGISYIPEDGQGGLIKPPTQKPEVINKEFIEKLINEKLSHTKDGLNGKNALNIELKVEGKKLFYRHSLKENPIFTFKEKIEFQASSLAYFEKFTIKSFPNNAKKAKISLVTIFADNGKNFSISANTQGSYEYLGKLNPKEASAVLINEKSAMFKAELDYKILKENTLSSIEQALYIDKIFITLDLIDENEQVISKCVISYTFLQEDLNSDFQELYDFNNTASTLSTKTKELKKGVK
ncbi:hypothetical protein A9M93_05380 [Campylobacter lari]|nr:hypothetical protein [Campylobacter lari]